ncbi:hypothetical protein [Halobacillus mangrovi]|uniref:Uncharacterized protein n=1 Tax=Halobacillus mangrovi TaxID=402384 RepID=A0A1W5ZQZ3_9BACI|nr:hypothetical protein [Halobacillus mangrovi]ARI75706.1 hypothetical protein HM131_02175 [Halobacillus mangrovi]
MNERTLTIEEFNDLLQQWSGKTIRITKHELRDQDTVIMNLDHIDYSRDTRRIDDYEPMHALHLHGTGRTETDLENFQPVPSSYYEIPLEDTTQYQFNDTHFSLVTDRGTYTIQLLGY